MDSIIFHSSECDWIISPQSFSLWDSNAVRNTQTPHHHPNMLPMSDKTSRRCFECCWRQCEAPWLVNWQKPLCLTAQSFNNAAWASVSEAAGPIPSSFFSGLSFLSIYSSSLFHNLVFFFPSKSSVFLITSGLFITDDTLHIALRRYPECRRKWGLPSHCVLLYWWKGR